jgi:hypothetical protein
LPAQKRLSKLTAHFGEKGGEFFGKEENPMFKIVLSGKKIPALSLSII